MDTTAPCWFCGTGLAPDPAGPSPAQCPDRAACFARPVAPPPGAPRHHPPGTGACPLDGDGEPCAECAAAAWEEEGVVEAAEGERRGECRWCAWEQC